MEFVFDFFAMFRFYWCKLRGKPYPRHDGTK